MIVETLELDNFRNYTHVKTDFSPGINLISGDNAQGKTNLLEAIAYLSSAKSHRTRYDKELIAFQGEQASLKGDIRGRTRLFHLEARLYRQRRKELFSNGIRLKNTAALSQYLKTILFCPEDLDLIRAGAAERRSFLDSAITQLRPRYAAALLEYRRIQEQKGYILRNWEQNPSLLDTLDAFNVRMAQTGAVLIRYRAYFIKRLARLAASIQTDFSGGREQLTLHYQTVSNISNPEASEAELIQKLREHQITHKAAERRVRQCLSGPHRDDLLTEIDARNARKFASQGQMRTAALSLKLACRQLFQEDTGEWPVLLLDDVLSELDAKRRRFILERIQDGQVFITGCEKESTTGRHFSVQAGVLTG